LLGALEWNQIKLQREAVLVSNIGGLALREGRINRFVIGILNGQTVDPSILETIMELTNEFPTYEVDIRKLGQETLLRDLLENRIDAAVTLVPNTTEPNEQFDYVIIRRIGMYLLAGTNDSIWKRKINVEALDRRLLIVQGEDHPGFTTLIRAIKEAGVLPMIKAAPNPETAAQWLENGVGVAVADEGEVIYSDCSRRQITAAPLQGVPDMSVALIRVMDHSSDVLDFFFHRIKKMICADH